MVITPGIRVETLNHLLRLELKSAGYYFSDDEDFLYLNRNNKIIDAWNATKVRVDVVLAAVNSQIKDG